MGSSAATRPGGRLLASAISDGLVRVWDVASGRVIRTLRGHSDWVWRVAYRPSAGRDEADPLLASASMDGTVRLWHVQAGQPGPVFCEHGTGLQALAFSPDGLVILWEVRTGQMLRTLSGHSRGVQEVAFGPDGSLRARAGWDRTVRLWDVAGGQVRHILEGHDDIAQGVTFSSDGETLGSSSYDGTVRLWDVATGQIRRVLRGHTNWVHYVTFGPDGRLLVSCSADETIRLGDPDTGRCLQRWRVPGPYAGMRIAGATGITEAQRMALRALGAIGQGRGRTLHWSEYLSFQVGNAFGVDQQIPARATTVGLTGPVVLRPCRPL